MRKFSIFTPTVSLFQFSIKTGFTLIELLVVIAIVGILAGILFVSYGAVQARTRDTQRKTQLAQYQSALETFANAQGGYPSFGTTVIGTSFCNTLGTALSDCPQDPRIAEDSTFAYTYQSDGPGNGTAVGTRYILWAKLEGSNDYWVISSDGRKATLAQAGASFPGAGAFPISSTPTPASPTLAPTSLPSSPTTAPTASPTLAPTLPPKKVFVTLNIWSGGFLGGLTGADAKCQQEASNAGLTGTFNAWLSDSSTSASSRLNHSSGPYKLVDNTTIVADNWTDLTTLDSDGVNYLKNTISEAANGSIVSGDWVWTNTNPDGTIFDSNTSCSNWSSGPSQGRTGTNGLTDSGWTSCTSCTVACWLLRHLYCFEQ